MSTLSIPEPYKPSGVAIALFAICSIAIICGIANHELADDEAQAWLLARDNSIPSLFKILPTEGHPPLWYFVVFPFAHAGFPYITVKFITAATSVSAIALLLFNRTTPNIIKFSLPLSYFIFYEYSCISRNYCLVIFFLAAVIYLNKNRFDRPLIYSLCVVGLFNAHVLMFSFCAGLTMLYITDAVRLKKVNRQTVLGMSCMITGGGYLLPYLATHEMTTFFVAKIPDHLAVFHKATSEGLFIGAYGYWGTATVWLAIILLTQRTQAFALLAMGLAGALYILAFRYPGVARHNGILFIIISGAYCIAPQYERKFRQGRDVVQYTYWLIPALVLTQLPNTLTAYGKDITGMYSGAEDAAEYIIDNNLSNKTIVGHQAISATAVLPYIPGKKQFYYSECERFGSYYIFDSCFTSGKLNVAVDYGVKIAHDKFKEHLPDVIFLFNYPVQPQTAQYLDLLYVTPEDPVRTEDKYFIYKFKPNVR